MGLKINITAELHLTEDEKKVIDAIHTIFPDANCTVNSGNITCTSCDISTFARLLKEQRIRDAARSIMLSNLRGNRLVFELNKQVATVGKVSFSVGDVPLGDIRVEVIGENLHHLIDEIAPNTRLL